MASRPIGALWVRKTQGGMTYMSGVLQDLGGDINIAVFKNNRKEKENQPDYQIVLSEKKEQRKTTATPFGEFEPQPLKPVAKEDIPVMEDNKNESLFPDDNAQDDIDVNKIPW